MFHFSQQVVLLVLIAATLPGCAGNKLKNVLHTIPYQVHPHAKLRPELLCAEPYGKLCTAVRYISGNYYLPLEHEKVVDAFIEGGTRELESVKGQKYHIVMESSDPKLCKSPYTKLCGTVQLLSERSAVSLREVIEIFMSGGMKELKLDTYSYYRGPPKKQKEKEGDEEEDDEAIGYSGIGISLKQKENQVMVQSVIPGFEAFLAGMRRGDIITHIRGNSVSGMNTREVAKLIRGKPKTRVRITVLRKCAGRSHTLTLMRWRIPNVMHIESRILLGNFGYISIPHFGPGVAERVKHMLRTLADRTHLKGLIINLRDNPGGRTKQAIRLASFFVEYGAVVHKHFQSRDEEHSVMSDDFLPEFRNLPIVVLVNEDSASSAEIFAGAIRDNHRGMLVGVRTFGKGVGQLGYGFKDKSAIHLTVYQFRTPLKRNVNGVGLEPDVTVREGKNDSCMNIDSQMIAAVRILQIWNALTRAR